MRWELYNEKKHKPDLLRFLLKYSHETIPPITSYDGGINGVIEICTGEKRWLYLRYHQDILTGVLGYVYPEPKVVYVYLLLFHPNYRKRSFKTFFKKILTQWDKDGITDLMFVTGKKNLIALSFNSRIANPDTEDKDSHGNSLICFHTPIYPLLKKFHVTRSNTSRCKNVY